MVVSNHLVPITVRVARRVGRGQRSGGWGWRSASLSLTRIAIGHCKQCSDRALLSALCSDLPLRPGPPSHVAASVAASASASACGPGPLLPWPSRRSPLEPPMRCDPPRERQASATQGGRKEKGREGRADEQEDGWGMHSTRMQRQRSRTAPAVTVTGRLSDPSVSSLHGALTDHHECDINR